MTNRAREQLLSPSADASVQADAQSGINCWAIGASILVTPTQQLPYVASELLDGAISDEEAASAIAIHSGNLMIDGLTKVINAVSTRLNTTTANLRNKDMKFRAMQLIKEDFTIFYNNLTQVDKIEATAIAPGLRTVRPNPFDSTTFLTEFLHSKKNIPLRWLIRPLSPPLWIEKGVAVDNSVELIGVNVSNAHKDV